jgi:hypothetical protein
MRRVGIVGAVAWVARALLRGFFETGTSVARDL